MCANVGALIGIHPPTARAPSGCGTALASTLRIADWDRTKLIDGDPQDAAVRSALSAEAAGSNPIHGVLCPAANADLASLQDPDSRPPLAATANVWAKRLNAKGRPRPPARDALAPNTSRGLEAVGYPQHGHRREWSDSDRVAADHVDIASRRAERTVR